MQRWAIVLPIIFTITTLSFSSLTDDAFATHVSTHHEIDIPAGAQMMGCSATLDACYDPDDITVNQFDTITWNNLAGNPLHTATSGSLGAETGVFNTGVLSAGTSSAEIVMSVPGTHNYYCEIHPWSVGSVTVVGGVNPVSIPLNAGDIDCAITPNACYDPDNITVVQGEIVEWTNNDVAPEGHTVTSDDGVSFAFGSTIVPLGNSDVVQLDTYTLDPGTYTYHCEVHL